MPEWYGHKYPAWVDFETFAESFGCAVGATRLSFPAVILETGGGAILIPESFGPLASTWALAHELGHLVQHTGPKLAFSYHKDERAADRWAACALIPAARVRRYRNASVDAFIGALSRHYEEILPIDCETRRLAARIAQARLWAMANEPPVHASGDSWG